MDSKVDKLPIEIIDTLEVTDMIIEIKYGSDTPTSSKKKNHISSKMVLFRFKISRII